MPKDMRLYSQLRGGAPDRDCVGHLTEPSLDFKSTLRNSVELVQYPCLERPPARARFPCSLAKHRSLLLGAGPYSDRMAAATVDLAGHTPGSVGVLAHTDGGWILLAGDAAWHTLQIDETRQKTSYPGGLADEDRDLSFQTLHRLHKARRSMRIIPTHDYAASRSLVPQGITFDRHAGG
ncbi:hypothetical protein MNVI_07040 [Mycobacterium noviomagense]|uniref:MBL fold metallo-hydrolase n=2 Tax=Mycobacterium noviomagense TaxID=459858 RepID=A0A7I7P9X5_9MYCO|nr:hypothetical protein MNVI_07040 [Mycobacterium noviomagense]